MVARPPSWEIVNLVTDYVDGKSLPMASCVSKSWNNVMSSDSLWRRAYAADYPVLFSNLGVAGVDPRDSFRSLYAESYTSTYKRRKIVPEKPVLSSKDLVFVISLVFKAGASINVAKRGDEIAHDPDGVFKFDIDVEGGRDLPVPFDADADREEDVKVTCYVWLKGTKKMFMMMNLEGKVKLYRGSMSMGLFSEEVPATRDVRGIVSDVKYSWYRLGGDEVHKLAVGLVNSKALLLDEGVRYLQEFILLDEGLRYLQEFLLKSTRAT